MHGFKIEAQLWRKEDKNNIKTKMMVEQVTKNGEIGDKRLCLGSISQIKN